MKRDKDEQILKKKYDLVDKEDFLTDRQKRNEKKMWKKKMTKLSRKKNKEIQEDALEESTELDS